LPDPNVTAFRFVQALTGEPPIPSAPESNLNGKDPVAVALGRKGGQYPAFGKERWWFMVGARMAR
jgi:hypothetical protein